MAYNTERENLRYSEYGRIIYHYVQYLLSMEDRTKRSQAAKQVIEMMTNINPQFKNLEEYKQKLWDHLYIMSDFKLEVDSPYPLPDRARAEFKKPERLPYPKSKIKNRTFGKHLSRFIEKSKEEKDPEKIKGFSETAAYFMKLSYLNWNNESVTDDSIRNDLKAMSDGTLNIGNEFNLDNVKAGGAYQQNYVKEKKKKNRNNRNFKGNNNGRGKKFFKKR